MKYKKVKNSKPYRWPPQEQIDEMREKLSKGPASQGLPLNPTSVQKAKYEICRQIIIYKREHEVTGRELAVRLGENESLISKVLHYYIEEFTLDRLMKFLNVLEPKATLELRVAK